MKCINEVSLITRVSWPAVNDSVGVEAVTVACSGGCYYADFGDLHEDPVSPPIPIIRLNH